ncbi:hypothetical protein QZH41_008132 [Actinostola sp. cb2023]|nr:hypothetical protein QZH41_008132 [Actinostola sp. cb2023]
MTQVAMILPLHRQHGSIRQLLRRIFNRPCCRYCHQTYPLIRTAQNLPVVSDSSEPGPSGVTASGGAASENATAVGPAQDPPDNGQLQMDYAAVSYASEEILKIMGLAAKGDVLALKRFADANLSGNNDQDKEREQRKRKLYDIIQKKDKRKPQIKESPQHNSINKTRHFKLGWLHLDEMKKKYVSVCYPRGGGSRDVDLPGNSTKDEIIEYAKTLFFPENESVFGKDYEMTFNLGNFKEQMITDIKDEANNVVPFTLEMYFKVHKLSRVRLYLMSKLLSSVQSDDEDLEDEEDEKDDVEDKEKDDVEDKHDDGEDDKVDVGDEGGVEIEQYMIDEEDLPPISTIIGSSSERHALKAMQDKEYSESLQADQEKERQRNKVSVNKEKEEERLESLMLAKKKK